jgi:hypothetical protein
VEQSARFVICSGRISVSRSEDWIVIYLMRLDVFNVIREGLQPYQTLLVVTVNFVPLLDPASKDEDFAGCDVLGVEEILIPT